jgi:hypothetical protein
MEIFLARIFIQYVSVGSMMPMQTYMVIHAALRLTIQPFVFALDGCYFSFQNKARKTDSYLIANMY